MVKVYTTGQAAKLCKVAPRTLAKWIDGGKLKGYRIPGSQDRRVPFGALVSFMQANGFPVDMIPGRVDRVLVVGCKEQPAFDGTDFAATFRETVFAAGMAFADERPACVVVDLSIGRIDAGMIAYAVKEAGVPCIAMVAGLDSTVDSTTAFFDGVVLASSRPAAMAAQLRSMIESRRVVASAKKAS